MGDLEFCEVFEHIVVDPDVNVIGSYAKAVTDAYLRLLRSNGEKVNQKLLRDEDRGFEQARYQQVA